MDADVLFLVSMRMSQHAEHGPTWSWTDLKKAAPALATFGAFVGSGFVSQIVACNVHEIGHAAVATPLGWGVGRIRWCAPGAGAVEYAEVGTWAGNLQGYAGGVVAAVFLYAVYLTLVSRGARPHRAPWWWAIGLGVVVWIGPQLVIAMMEGSAGPNEDYTELFRTRGAIFVPLVLLAAVAGAVLYVLRWRLGSGAASD